MQLAITLSSGNYSQAIQTHLYIIENEAHQRLGRFKIKESAFFTFGGFMFQQYDPVRVLGKLAFGQLIFDRLAWRQFRHVTLKQQHQTAMCVDQSPNRG